ncbi:nickel/cobalt transporter, partial [Thermodesulfobacteriota bacterium]
AAGHVLLLCLALSGFLRMGILSVVGATFICAALLLPSFGRRNTEDPAWPHGPDLRILPFCFGLLHGFLLIRAPSGTTPFPGTGTILHSMALLPALVLLSIALDRFVFRFRGRTFAACLILMAGTVVLLLRNTTLPFSSLDVEGARDLLLGFIQRQETGSSVPVAALILSVVLGGLHALTPGHGKTIVAAYLVGTRGRVSDAVVLGIIVTFTHTFIIIALALLALFASQYILPDQLMPWITCSSGLLILILGAYLFQSRLRNYFRFGATATHPDDHAPHDDEGIAEGHDHAHALPHNHHRPGLQPRTIRHSHDGVSHTHALPSPDVSFWSLAALGVSGGIVPCPDALAVLLIAVSINRILLGIFVILAFSMGLAAVLIAIGIVMVKARPLLDRAAGGGRLTTLWLPLISAALVTILGAVLLWKSIPW